MRDLAEELHSFQLKGCEMKVLYYAAVVFLMSGGMLRAQSVACASTLSPSITEVQTRGEIALADHDYPGVERELSPVVAVHPEACNLMLLLGRAYLYNKDDRNATVQFLHVLAGDPKNKVAKLEMARLYGYHSKYQQSNVLYKELLSADPTDEQASIGLARNLMRMQRLHEAQAAVDAGLAAHPNSIRLQEYKDALARHQNGVEAPPRPADVQTWLYLITDSAGDRVTENFSRVDVTLVPRLSAQLGVNFRYLTSLGTVIVGSDGNTDNTGGYGSITSTTFDGSGIMKYHPKSWITFTGGGGGIAFSDGTSRALFQSGVAFHPSAALYFDTDYIRIPVLPTQQAAAFDLSSQGLRSSLDWVPQQWRVHVDASELKYTDGNLRHAQNVEVIRWFGNRTVRFGAGYSGSHLTFREILSHGYFSPDTYQNHNGSGLLQVRHRHSFTGEYQINFGAETISGLPFRPIYELSAHNTVHLGSFDLHGDYARFHFTQATGAFLTDVGTFGIKYKF